MKKPPCKDCPSRSQACWAKCELYQIWKKEQDRVLETKNRIKERESIYVSSRNSFSCNRRESK